MSQPVLKAEASWGQPSSVANAREEILTALKNASGVGPGTFLKQLREVANLELREAATQLSLSTILVQALENDDFKKLPAPIYTKGFYRRYCELLAIAPEPVIKAYERTAELELPDLSRVSIRPEMNSLYTSVRYAGYAVVGLIVLLVLYWAQGIDFSAIMGLFSGGEAVTTDSATELSLPVLTEDTLLTTPALDSTNH